MTKLTDTQAIILSTAAGRADRNILPLPESLRGGAATKVMNALAKRGLIVEIEADRRKPDQLWKQTGGRPVISQAGLAAIGAEHGDADNAPAAETETDEAAAPRTPKTRTDTKHAILIAMLRAEGGASIEEIAEALQWRHHSIRGAMSGALKKKLGLTIVSEKPEDGPRRYRISEVEETQQ